MNLKTILFPKNLSDLKISSKVSLIVLGISLLILSVFVCFNITFGPYSSFFRKDICLFVFSIMFPLCFFLTSMICFYGYFQIKKIKTVDQLQNGNKKFNIYALPVFLFPQLFGAVAFLRFAPTYSLVVFITVLIFLLVYFFAYKSALRQYKKIKDSEDSLL